MYTRYWGLDRKEEKAAFEQFIDLIMKRWKVFPDLYIYHYAHYEPSAIKRLAARHGTREIAVDRLLRAERFIDLFAVVRESLQASVESYSLKDLERFTDYVRKIDLPKAAAARRRLGSALDLKAIALLPEEDLLTVEDYNKDDCLATAALRQWMENIYQGQLRKGNKLSRPELKTGEASETLEEREGIVQQIFEQLIQDVPEDPMLRNDECNAKWLLAHQVEYFRRESRSAWWEFFYLHEMDPEDLLEERKGIAGLEFEDTISGTGKCPIHRYCFPMQEISIEIGDELHETLGDKIGEVSDISIENGTIDIKKTSRSAGLHPTAIHIKEIVPPGVLASSLQQFAQSVVGNDLNGDGPYQAARHLLLKEKPHILEGNDGLLALPNESVNESAIRIVSNLDNSYLPIQGPPGTGKTYIGAQMIIELYLLDKRIGVTAVSHKVIRNLLKKVLEIAGERMIPMEVVHKVSSKSENTPDGLIEQKDNGKALQALDDGLVVGGTSWLWARDDAVERLDYLFVDEAGQMSLANVLATTRSAKNLVLLGDP